MSKARFAMSLRAKFLALFAVFAVIPLISIGIFDYVYSLRALEALIATEVGEIATRAATIFAQTLPDYGTDVWLFSTREGEPPVAITRDENSEFWYYQPSPDGATSLNRARSSAVVRSGWWTWGTR